MTGSNQSNRTAEAPQAADTGHMSVRLRPACKPPPLRLSQEAGPDRSTKDRANHRQWLQCFVHPRPSGTTCKAAETSGGSDQRLKELSLNTVARRASHVLASMVYETTLPSHRDITPRELWELYQDESDVMAFSGSADDGDGVASDDLNQTAMLSDTDAGGVVSRFQKRRRITTAQAQAESSRAERSSGPMNAVPGPAGRSISPSHGMDGNLHPLPNHLIDPHKAGNSSTDHTCTQANHSLRCDGPAATHHFLNNPTFSPFTPGTNVVFLSNLIPRHFDSATRRHIMDIFKRFAPYVPLCIMRIPDVSQMIWELGEDLLEALRKRPFRYPFGPNDRGWPSDPAPHPAHPRSLPVEIFEEIGSYLPRDSVQNMRLVNHEFEKKMSRFAFRSVVVPFRPKIYGFCNVPTATSTKLPVEHSAKSSKAVKGKGKAKEVIPEHNTYGSSESSSEIDGKGKEKEIIPDDRIHEPTAPALDAESKGKEKEKETLEDDENGQSFCDSFRDTYDPNATHVKDGMRIFEQWGPEIKKFALTFEVPEDSLKGLLPKKKSTMQRTFWGSFEWPNIQYNRYDEAAILEDKADETSAMTTAFSKLRGLQELGLSMISGLGWLNGPDVSDRVKLYKPKPVVFGPHYALPDKEYREADERWGKIVEDQTLASKEIKARNQRNFFKADREYWIIGNGVQCTMPKMVLKNYSPRARWIPPPIMFNNINVEARKASELAGESELDSDEYSAARAVIAARTGLSVDQLKGDYGNDPDHAIPNSLTREQKEWLMEMDWAQRAFLASWCIAVLDNATIFHSLKRFTIGNISSGLLPSLQREDIWHALPNLEGLTVFVCPDWREVTKNSSDEVDTPRINPSLAQEHFQKFLSALFAKNRSIKTLKIGYVGGGEQAPGILARNRNVVAAPIMRFASPQASVDIEGTLYFPNVEHLTLVNCWITPGAATDFFANMQDSDIQTITFDSVSLIAGGHPYNHVPAVSPGDPAAIALRRNKWLRADPTPGCWCDIINTITPGHGIDHMRILYGRNDIEQPDLPFQTSLQKITFNSCGYVRLPNISHASLDQSSVPDTMHGSPPACLRKRTERLQKVMMQAPEDILLGTIVPALMDEEEGCLSAVWGMEMGWGKDKEKEKWNTREDGAGEGGLGRFRGCVKRVEKGAGVRNHPLLKDAGFNGGRRGRSKRRAPAAGASGLR
ncbi:MAG: hypothetical protein Q9208_002416 [Pyrenodesmia sp. 3 TL-2023]